MKKIKIEYCITFSDEECYGNSDEKLKELALYEVWNHTDKHDNITIITPEEEEAINRKTLTNLLITMHKLHDGSGFVLNSMGSEVSSTVRKYILKMYPEPKYTEDDRKEIITSYFAKALANASVY